MKNTEQKKPSVAKQISEFLSKINNRKDWTIRDWEAKDSEGLKIMANDMPDAYAKIYNEYYKSKK